MAEYESTAAIISVDIRLTVRGVRHVRAAQLPRQGPKCGSRFPQGYADDATLQHRAGTPRRRRPLEIIS